MVKGQRGQRSVSIVLKYMCKAGKVKRDQLKVKSQDRKVTIRNLPALPVSGGGAGVEAGSVGGGVGGGGGANVKQGNYSELTCTASLRGRSRSRGRFSGRRSGRRGGANVKQGNYSELTCTTTLGGRSRSRDRFSGRRSGRRGRSKC